MRCFLAMTRPPGTLFEVGHGEALGHVPGRNGRALAAGSGTRPPLHSKPVDRHG
jgi:hypothetical protein